MRRAVFLDRDGVIIEDIHLLTSPSQVRILDGVPEALSALAGAGFALIAVTNQTVVARGLATEDEVRRVHDEIDRRLHTAGGQPVDAYYVCPHHPAATRPEYRLDCECRKPRPGLLLRAARERGIDLAASYMIGDRVTDVIAGIRAGCTTILLETGAHAAPPIETSDPIDPGTRPDLVFRDLASAARAITAKDSALLRDEARAAGFEARRRTRSASADRDTVPG